MIRSITMATVIAVGLALSGVAPAVPHEYAPAPPAVAQRATPSPSAKPTDGTRAAYHEDYRPQFHYSLPTGWIGDPNGLVFKDGL